MLYKRTVPIAIRPQTSCAKFPNGPETANGHFSAAKRSGFPRLGPSPAGDFVYSLLSCIPGTLPLVCSFADTPAMNTFARCVAGDNTLWVYDSEHYKDTSAIPDCGPAAPTVGNWVAHPYTAPPRALTTAPPTPVGPQIQLQVELSDGNTGYLQYLGSGYFNPFIITGSTNAASTFTIDIETGGLYYDSGNGWGVAAVDGNPSASQAMHPLYPILFPPSEVGQDNGQSGPVVSLFACTWSEGSECVNDDLPLYNTFATCGGNGGYVGTYDSAYADQYAAYFCGCGSCYNDHRVGSCPVYAPGSSIGFDDGTQHAHRLANSVTSRAHGWHHRPFCISMKTYLINSDSSDSILTATVFTHDTGTSGIYIPYPC